MRSCWLVAAFISACANAQTLTEFNLNVDGLDRQYFVYAPSNMTLPARFPMVLVLHGGGGNARQTMGFCGFNPIAEKEKFIAVYPNGYRKGWHDGRTAPDIEANRESIDDVKFIREVIKAVSKKYPVDTTRIFSTGISNGAMMSLFLAHSLSDKIRGIAPVCGNISLNMEKTFKLQLPVSILVINGTEDTLVPYAGGPVLSKRADRGHVTGTDQMMKIWTQQLGLPGEPIIHPVEDRDPRDGCKAVRYNYPCPPGNFIELIRIEGGGHTWPGGKQYLPKAFVGRVCRDFKAEEVIWDFFKRIPPR